MCSPDGTRATGGRADPGPSGTGAYNQEHFNLMQAIADQSGMRC